MTNFDRFLQEQLHDPVVKAEYDALEPEFSITQTEEYLHQRYIAEKLSKAKQQAADPNTVWQDHDSVWQNDGLL